MKIQRSDFPKMAALYSSGKTLQEVGDCFGVSRERVRQVIRGKFGLDAYLDGRSKRSISKETKAAANREARLLAKYGCTKEQYTQMLEIGRRMTDGGVPFCRTPTGAWHSQRRTAMTRKIPWEISLWDWWMVWQASGKWEQRGRGRGYMMCRKGDQGPYSLDNVYIATGAHNASLAHQLREKPARDE